MITESLKLSSQNQVTITTPIREALGVVAGDCVLVSLEDNEVRMYPAKKSWAKQTSGIAKNIYKAVGGGANYLKNERKTWNKR
ncbi:AbrB/MazE/SpoVT family DNA-binding domain-containing protein [Candidatus Parcubacteria bacterium]|nr:AbrB/MazE/SpoVT family DNA-binding domain-containing protein [Patescibacteria group bacterium]MBU4380730.1 AbrB/MazE/SpoVT family DNA-binding domain-containing protein [Patescibacteria group bacterium]MCG2689647.1 AbrB/MazE/SpoVT family DNA-binding domain-containing protein [Candidatus Parcubacteria bacterium]